MVPDRQLTDVAEGPAANSPRKSSASRNIAGTALTNTVLGGIGILTGVIAARWLGPSGRGELAAIQMWPSLLSSLAMIGLPDAVVYFCAKHPSESKRYLVASVLIALSVMPAFGLAGYLLLPRLVSTQPPRIIQAARVYLMLMPIYALIGLPHQLLRGIQRYRLWNVMRVVPAAIWLAVLIVGVALRITDPVQLTGLFLWLLAAAGPVLTLIVWSRAAGAATPTSAIIKKLVKFGLPSASATLPQFFNLKLDQIMVAAYLPARELGVYVVAVSWGTCIPMLSSALGIVVSTQIAANPSPSERQRTFSHGVRNGTWMIGAAVILLAAATPLGISAVFGRAFQSAVIPASILVVASGVNALNGLLEELLRGYGRPAATLWAEGAAVATGLPALLLLLPRAGLTGAALASLVGYLTATIVLVVQSRRAADLQLLDAVDPRAFLGARFLRIRGRGFRLRLGEE
jgi:O-antigen/teichoic acid export membrane protein